MKSIVSILSLVAVFIISSCSSSQSSATSSKASVSTETFKVTGVCGMCKRRIETAAFGISGVKSAQWAADKQTLTVSFDAKKANAETIQKRIAAAGHDTEKIKADDKAYANLPECCKYRDGVEVHEN